MMRNKVEISVIIPIYKGQEYVRAIMTTIQKNSEKFDEGSIELILVNDYPEIPLVVVPEEDIRFKLITIENPKNLGIQATRINGLSKAEGKYIMFLDQDDKLSDDALFSQYSKIGEGSAIISNGYYEDSAGNQLRLFKNFEQQKLVNDFKYYFYFGNLIASPGLVLIRKDAIPNIWVDNIMTINGADDWLLWVSFLTTHKFKINTDFLYTHCNVGENASDNEIQMLCSSKEALDIFKLLKSDSKLVKVYERRLQMRSGYRSREFSIKKIYQYLINIDILWYVLKFKLKFRWR